MPRKGRVDEFNVEVVEDSLFMLGEAEDWLVRKEWAVLDLLDRLESGKTTFIAARLQVGLDFSEGQNNLNQFRERFAGTALKADFPYLDNNLRLPMLRLIFPLPTPQEPG
jgi:hypothetical protein